MPYEQKFPMRQNEGGHYFIGNHTIQESIIEQLTMLTMTKKGEYLMDGDYGVGINYLIMENTNDDIKQQVQQDLESQIGKYIKRVILHRVRVFDRTDYEAGRIASEIGVSYAKHFSSGDVTDNTLLIGIYYSIEGVSDSDSLFLTNMGIS
jgi:phage baseplate assembly protein W